MKKKLLIFALACVAFCQSGFSLEIYWYLAASMSNPGKEIVQKFNEQNKNIRVYLVLGGSSMLLSRIAVSGKGDLYTPGSEFFLRKAEELGIVKSNRPLLLQKPVIGLSASGVKKIHNFTDLLKPGIKIADSVHHVVSAMSFLRKSLMISLVEKALLKIWFTLKNWEIQLKQQAAAALAKLHQIRF